MVGVVRQRSKLPVYTVLVIDATTGQNGLQQAREFNRELELDALIVTKLDGTAKGGIALAVSHELELPIIKIGVGEGLDDLRDFDAHDFARALVGVLFVPLWGYFAACIASPVAWFFACFFLIPAYIVVYRRLKKEKLVPRVNL